jgi:hypothetical protein
MVPLMYGFPDENIRGKKNPEPKWNGPEDYPFLSIGFLFCQQSAMANALIPRQVF